MHDANRKDAKTFEASDLYCPATVAGLDLPNRIVMAPMTRGFSEGGVPPAGTLDYYRKRAEGGVGLIITEGVAIDHPTAQQNPRIPHFYGEAALAEWGRIARAVQQAGGLIMPQLWHVGATFQAEENPDVARGAVSPSGIGALDDRAHGEPLDEHEIEALVGAYAAGAEAAMKHGFDGVELHGAHGYLIDEFFWQHTNRREDRWGGALAERTRFGAEIVRECRRRTRPDFPIVLRFSQWKLQDYGARLAETPKELESFLAPLVEAGVDIFHCSTRRYWETEFGSDMNLAGWTKKLTGKPVITVGSVGLKKELFETFSAGNVSEQDDLDRLYAMFERGDFDLVAVGRALITDPEWVKKAEKGDFAGMKPFSSEHLATLA